MTEAEEVLSPIPAVASLFDDASFPASSSKSPSTLKSPSKTKSPKRPKKPTTRKSAKHTDINSNSETPTQTTPAAVNGVNKGTPASSQPSADETKAAPKETPLKVEPPREPEPPPKVEPEPEPPREISPTEDNETEENETVAPLKKDVTDEGARVVETFSRGDGGGRRMTFRMQAVPDAVLKNDTQYVDDAKELCGNLKLEDEVSDSEDFDFVDINPTKIAAEEDGHLSQAELEETLFTELGKANDETDLLYGRDDLNENETFSAVLGTNKARNTPPEDQVETPKPPAAVEPPRVDDLGVPEKVDPRTMMDPLALRLWYMKLKACFAKGVKVVRVEASGNRFIRTVTITNARLIIKSAKPSLAAHKIHLATIKYIKHGYSSMDLRNLLNIADDNEPVPPPANCAAVFIPHTKTLSLVFLTETARNEFLFLLRVDVNDAKRLYGDKSLDESLDDNRL